MLLLLSFATAVAVADAAMIACEPMYVASILPGAGAADVPTDAVVAVLVAGDCGSAPFYDVVLYGPDDAVVVEDRFDAPLPGDRLTVDPGGLAASTSYRVEVTPGDGWGEITETTFTTGNSGAAALEGVPTLDLREVTWSRRDALVSAVMEATAADDPHGGLLEIRDESNATIASGAIGDDPLWAWISAPARQVPDQVCAQAFQIRITGEEVPGELVCEVPERQRGPLGCSTAASPAGLLPLILGLLLIRRRS